MMDLQNMSRQRRGPRIPRQLQLSGDRIRLSGYEEITYVNVGASFTTNYVILDPGAFITPPGGASTKAFKWLNQVASCYGKFKFLSARLEYEPACSTTQGGRFVGCWTGDQNDTVPGNSADIMRSECARSTPVWQGVSVNAVVPKVPEFAFTEDSLDPRVGCFTWGTDSGAATATIAGYVGMHYVVDLFVRTPPNLNA